MDFLFFLFYDLNVFDTWIFIINQLILTLSIAFFSGKVKKNSKTTAIAYTQRKVLSDLSVICRLMILLQSFNAIFLASSS